MNRDVVIIASGRLLAATIGLVTLRVSTTILSAEQFGLMALMLGAQTFSTLIVINPIGQWVNRNTHVWWDEGTLLPRLAQYHLPVFGAAFVSAAIFGLWQLLSFGQLPLLACFAVFTSVFAVVWNGTLVSLLNMLGYRKIFVALSNVSLGAGLLLAIVLTSINASAAVWLIGQSCGLGLGAIFAWHFLNRKKNSQSFDGRLYILDKSTLLTFCMPLATATAMMWVLTAGWRFIADSHWGLQALGILYVAVTLTLQIWTLAETLLMQILIPLFYRGLSGQDKAGMGRVFSSLFNAQLPIYLLLLSATILSSHALLVLFVNEQYHQASQLVALAAFIEFFRVMSNVAVNAAQATFNTRSLIKPYSVAVFCLLVFLGVSAYLKLPVESAVVSIAIAGSVLLLLMIIAMKKLLPWSIDLSGLKLPTCCVVVALVSYPFIPQPVGLPQAIKVVASVGFVSVLITWYVVRFNGAYKALLKIRLNGAQN